MWCMNREGTLLQAFPTVSLFIKLLDENKQQLFFTSCENIHVIISGHLKKHHLGGIWGMFDFLTVLLEGPKCH